MACEQDEEMLWLKNVMGLSSAVIGLLICWVYSGTMTVYKATNAINDKIFDGQLITLGDYSVQGKISWEQYQKFKTEVLKGKNDDHTMKKFEKYFVQEIELWMMRNDKDKSIPESQFAVADIQFAFDNDGMQSLLTKRADALKAGKFDKANELEDEMTKYKNDNFDDITCPRYFYVTFHTEYAYHKALEFHHFNFLEMEIEIKQATEPTDIIWENR